MEQTITADKPLTTPKNLLPAKKVRRILPPVLTALQFAGLKVGQWVVARESGKVYEITELGKGRLVKDITAEPIELTGPTRPLSASGLTAFKAPVTDEDVDEVQTEPQVEEVRTVVSETSAEKLQTNELPPETEMAQPLNEVPPTSEQLTMAQSDPIGEKATTPDLDSYTIKAKGLIMDLAGDDFTLPPTFTEDVKNQFDKGIVAHEAAETLLYAYIDQQPATEATRELTVDPSTTQVEPEVEAAPQVETPPAKAPSPKLSTRKTKKVVTNTVDAGGGFLVDVVESVPEPEVKNTQPRAKLSSEKLKLTGPMKEIKIQPETPLRKSLTEQLEGSTTAKANQESWEMKKRVRIQEACEKAERAALNKDEDGEVEETLGTYNLEGTDRYENLPLDKARRRNNFRRINDLSGQWVIVEKVPDGIQIKPYLGDASKTKKTKKSTTKSSSARIEWNGLGMCEFLRYAGSQQWPKSAVMTVAQKLGFSPSPTTAYIQMKKGKDGEGVPQVDKSAANELASYIDETPVEPKAPKAAKVVKSAKKAQDVKPAATPPTSKNQMPAAGETRSERKAAKRAAKAAKAQG